MRWTRRKALNAQPEIPAGSNSFGYVDSRTANLFSSGSLTNPTISSHSSSGATMVVKTIFDRNVKTQRTAISVSMSVRFPLLLTMGLLSLSACHANGQVVKVNDPTGHYKLISVNGAQVPTTVLHGDVEVKVSSGTFTINPNGTCSTKTIFGPPAGAEMSREVSATYKQQGSTLNMQWKGAGRTVGTIKGDSFTMNNEGMIFSYKKQPGDEVLDRFLGTWRSIQTLGPQAEENGIVDLNYRRVLGGKFVQEMGKVAGENSAMIMFSFDTDQNLYRGWRFAATGPPTESTGNWNPVSNTLEWTSVAKAGQEFTMTSNHHFVSDSVFEWDAVGKDSDGKVLFRVEGKATRTSELHK
jgi:hypothetical protein